MLVLFVLALVSCGRGRNPNRAGAEASSAHPDRALPSTEQTAPHGGAAADVTVHQACKWPGWYRAPRLAAECAELCVPDNVKSAVPSLRWKDKSDWCAGCRALDTPWATTDDALKDAVGGGVDGDGPHGEFVTLGIGPQTEPTWDEDHDITFMITDGTTLADLPPGFSWPVLQNGYLVGIYNVSPAPLRTAAIVVRIGDGTVWRSLLPASYSWNAPLFRRPTSSGDPSRPVPPS